MVRTWNNVTVLSLRISTCPWAAVGRMDVFPGWKNYVERLEEQWRAIVTEEDTVVVAGDISRGMSLQESRTDFQ